MKTISAMRYIGATTAVLMSSPLMAQQPDLDKIRQDYWARPAIQQQIAMGCHPPTESQESCAARLNLSCNKYDTQAGCIARQFSPAAETKPSENRPQILIAASRNISPFGGGTCSVNLRVGNGIAKTIDRFSARFELVNRIGVMGVPIGTLSQFTVELVPSGSYRSYDAFIDTWCDERSVIRIVRVDFCQVGGQVFSDCGDAIIGNTPKAETKSLEMAVTYVPIP